jgi:hypothetical protein
MRQDDTPPQATGDPVRWYELFVLWSLKTKRFMQLLYLDRLENIHNH